MTDEAKQELADCECGHSPNYQLKDSWGWRIVCPSQVCAASTAWYLSSQVAASVWNRRAQDADAKSDSIEHLWEYAHEIFNSVCRQRERIEKLEAELTLHQSLGVNDGVLRQHTQRIETLEKQLATATMPVSMHFADRELFERIEKLEEYTKTLNNVICNNLNFCRRESIDGANAQDKIRERIAKLERQVGTPGIPDLPRTCSNPVIQAAIDRFQGNLSRAAKELGISRESLVSQLDLPELPKLQDPCDELTAEAQKLGMYDVQMAVRDKERADQIAAAFDASDSATEPPKEGKRTFEVWINLFTDENGFLSEPTKHLSRYDADRRAQIMEEDDGAKRIACKRVVVTEGDFDE